MKRLALVLSSLVALLALVPIHGCGSGTAGRSIFLEVAVESIAEPGRALGQFSTDTGWDVTLDEARIAIGPIYAYAPTDTAMARLGRALSPVGVAYAHGGADPFNGRHVRAEVRDQIAFDALSPAPASFGEIDGEAGLVDSLTVALEAPEAANVDAMHAHHAWVSGTATQGAMTVAFEGGVDLPEDGLIRRVEGIRVDDVLDDAVTLVVGTRVLEWLRDAHFDRLTETAPSGRMLITPESQVRGAFYLGIRTTAAWSARVEASEGAMGE